MEYYETDLQSLKKGSSERVVATARRLAAEREAEPTK